MTFADMDCKTAEMKPLGVVLDSNYFLQFQDAEAVDWTKILNAQSVTLLVPLTVLDELERKKNSDNSRLKRRSRLALQKLGAWIYQDPPSEIRTSVRIRTADEVSIKWLEENGFDPKNPDHRIIGSALCAQKSNEFDKVLLLSSDHGLRARAFRKVETFVLDKNYELPEEDDPIEKENKFLKSENMKLSNLKPKLRLTFSDGSDLQKFELREMPILQEKDVVDFIDEMKREHPLHSKDVAPVKSANPIAEAITAINSVNNLGPKDSEWDEYNSILRKRYEECDQYYRDNYYYDEFLSRTIGFELFIQNYGTASASDIDIWLHFPDGFTLYKEVELPKRPEPPMFPEKPKGLLGMFSRVNDISGLWNPSESFLSRAIRESPNVSEVTIRETNSYEADLYVRKLKHLNSERIEKFFVEFPDINALKNFSIDYRLHAEELPTPVVGKVNVIVNRLTVFLVNISDN